MIKVKHVVLFVVLVALIGAALVLRAHTDAGEEPAPEPQRAPPAPPPPAEPPAPAEPPPPKVDDGATTE